MKRRDITTDNRFLQSSTLSKRGTQALTISQAGEQGSHTNQQHGHGGRRGRVAAVTVAVAVPDQGEMIQCQLSKFIKF